MTQPEKQKEFTRTLFKWHKKSYREMKWRNTHDPYRILVSEIMLQQTQVERVKGKYVEFLKKFPTVRTLAKASLGDVLRVWSGLGYNRRAKYLHECAKQVLALHHGKFPDDVVALRALPGIGISTSAALLAFAYDKDEPMIDTNIRRILTRVFFLSKLLRPRLGMVTPSDKDLYVFARSLIPKGRGRIWNYAMLDLGATLCTARSHKNDCPLMKLHGPVSDFVYKKPQKKFKDSDRYYRGKILAQLVGESRTASELCNILQLPSIQLKTILLKLVHEELILQRGDHFRLP